MCGSHVDVASGLEIDEMVTSFNPEPVEIGSSPVAATAAESIQEENATSLHVPSLLDPPAAYDHSIEFIVQDYGENSRHKKDSTDSAKASSVTTTTAAAATATTSTSNQQRDTDSGCSVTTCSDPVDDARQQHQVHRMGRGHGHHRAARVPLLTSPSLSSDELDLAYPCGHELPCLQIIADREGGVDQVWSEQEASQADEHLVRQTLEVRLN